MGVQDLVVTPIYLIVFTLVAYFLRPYVTDTETRRYFLPAIWVRFAGAIFLGVVYQFYYDGGDTFNYHTHGSKWIWEAILNEPAVGFKLLLNSGGEYSEDVFQYSQRIWYYGDVRSYFIVRLSAFFGLFTLHTYSANALFFAAFSFSGLWAMYSAIQKGHNFKYLPYAILFVPSVIFWGSGVLKDTVTIGAVGWLIWGFYSIIEMNKVKPFHLAMLLLSALLIYQIKSYILICLLPTVIVWWYLKKFKRIRSAVIRTLILPFFAVIVVVSVFGVTSIVSNEQFSISTFTQKAAITSYDIRYGWGSRTNGDGGYDLGVVDGTWQNAVTLFPAAINVSLFRPYLWEVKTPFMLLAAVESLMIFLITIRFVIKGYYKQALAEPFLIFCLLFSLLFAFAVGISTFNFGTLMRYKIPMLSLYLISILPSKHITSKAKQKYHE